MSEELKPCPFCGSTDIETFYNKTGVDHLTCQYCGATAKDWNTRHEPDDVNRMRNLLEDVVNPLDLSEIAIETHGPLGTEPAELVKLVLQQKDREIALLHHESDELPEWLKTQIKSKLETYETTIFGSRAEYHDGIMDTLEWVLSLRKPEENK
jgi:Zn ribbon nucleic-acid-binding protein